MVGFNQDGFFSFRMSLSKFRHQSCKIKVTSWRKKINPGKSHYMIKKPLRPKKQQEEPSRSPPAQLRIWLTFNNVFRISSEIKENLVSKVLRISKKNIDSPTKYFWRRYKNWENNLAPKHLWGYHQTWETMRYDSPLDPLLSPPTNISISYIKPRKAK